VETPAPALRAGGVVVRTSFSLLRAGTEAAGMGGGGNQNLMLKALRNPQLMRKMMDSMAGRGMRETVDLVRARLRQARPSGYSCSGIVVEIAAGAGSLRVGDRVACAGAGYANHAGYNFVPRNLVAPLPPSVSFEEGAFATLGAIALHGVRRFGPTLGERVVVLGLGLLGQLVVQLLRATGAEPIGVDPRPERLERARALGLTHTISAARDLTAGVMDLTAGEGADGVIVTAAGGDGELLNRCFAACRRKGRVVLVGDVPIRIRRDRMYHKELDFLLSTSSGPGRYDPRYEEQGLDYPLAYVRWTEGRNLQAVLRLIETGLLQVRPLIERRFPIEQAAQAYESLAAPQPPIGVLLDYHCEAAPQPPPARSFVRHHRAAPARPGQYRVGVVGYGNYFRAVLQPLLQAHRGFALTSVCARSPLSVRAAVEKAGFARGTTDYHELLNDPEIDVVYVATRHDSHFAIARDAILASKAVFVEKPMCLSADEGLQLMDLVRDRQALLTVGFNRRFSPHAKALKQALGALAGPKQILYRVNAGALPQGHWSEDPVEGGGRLLGEGVHFFDFMRYLCAARPLRVIAAPLPGAAHEDASVSVEFDDGSVGTLLYTSQGAPAMGKERVEVFAGGCSMVLEEYRRLEVFPKGRGLRTRHSEKGQREQLENFYQALNGQGALGVTVEDGYYATWCAEQAMGK
jgi:predicted dehydrogenase/threonine dehydrogenase-like Zn-dependent dehydrogenase